MRLQRGKFITLEGVDGAGKSTHVEWLAAELRSAGIDLVTTREPGGTPLGEKLRQLLLSEPMRADTEVLLMFAARREHLETVIWPALDAGRWVLSDRFSDATFAYQGGGRGIPAERLQQLERWVHPDFQPDLTLLFDVPTEVALDRLGNADRAVRDRFEQEQRPFHQQVRAAYLARASAASERFRIIDGTLPIEHIRQLLAAELRKLTEA